MTNIVFLPRAYNDLDTQLPLICAFAKEKGAHITVLGIAADGIIINPNHHEAAAYARALGVTITTVLERPQTPLFYKLLYKTEQTLLALKKNIPAKLSPLHLPAKALHVGLLHAIKQLIGTNKPHPWMKNILKSFSPDAIISDEAIMQTGRSYMLESVVQDLAKQGLKRYTIRTGHHVYADLLPSNSSPPSYKAGTTDILFMENDSFGLRTAKEFYPQEKAVTYGNLRMDKDWINTLNTTALKEPYYSASKICAPLPEGKIKIVMMLSKMSYGVEAENLKDLIRTLGQMPHIALALKPHTRGMKFDFMPESEIGHARVVDNVPSALLCEWADLTLFTGSSIAFHALILGKAAGYLKFCQTLETVFDNGQAATCYRSADQLLNELRTHLEKGTKPAAPIEAQAFLTRNVHHDGPAGQTAQRYKNAILANLADHKADLATDGGKPYYTARNS